MTEKLGEFKLNEVYEGDSLELLKKLPENSIDIMVASRECRIIGRSI